MASATTVVGSSSPQAAGDSTVTRAVGAMLSFLVPGLGQIMQGLVRKNVNRLTKGLFFLVALWGMFFYGMWLGHWQNVYLPHKEEQQIVDGKRTTLFGRITVSPLVGNLYTRLHYVGQFWIGVAAWPALWNYFYAEGPIFGEFQKSPGSVAKGNDVQRDEDLRRFEGKQNELQKDMGRLWDIAWVYTVIAGVLNILVIYDAWAGPVHLRKTEAPDAPANAPANASKEGST